MQNPIQFGTGCWRGILADDFTDENVRIAAGAIARYVREHEDAGRGICIAYDTDSCPSASRRSLPRWRWRRHPRTPRRSHHPTPALSYAVKHLRAAGGVMITPATTLPVEWVKYKASYGGSGSPAIMGLIQGYLGQGTPWHRAAPRLPRLTFSALCRGHLGLRRPQTDRPPQGKKYAIDCMYARDAAALGIFGKIGIDHTEIRAELNPLFPGIQPEPIRLTFERSRSRC